MHAIADTEKLLADGVITQDQAKVIEHRAREAMIALGVNFILCFGIIAATAGLVFWLANPVSVALTGFLLLASGLLILARNSELLRMFGNAATLIGAGMLIGGASLELVDKHEDLAGGVLTAGGALIVLVASQRYVSGGLAVRFVLGSITVMGLAAHLVGIELLCFQFDVGSPFRNLIMFYYAAAIAFRGWLLDVRLLTALAIVPFAQILETGTEYFHAAYVFYSPEPTLSIATLVLLILGCLWFAQTSEEREARHLRILAILGFVVANLCALVGSLWGDTVGQTIWGPGRYSSSGYADWDSYAAARDAFEQTALVISPDVYSILWALALVVMIFWAATRHQRGLFNTALTFAAIHAYTQMFETFADEPLAYVIGGLMAIPLAWGIWRLNAWISGRAAVG